MTQPSPMMRHVRATVELQSVGTPPFYMERRPFFPNVGDVDIVALAIGNQILAMRDVIGIGISPGAETTSVVVDLVVVEAYPDNAMITPATAIERSQQPPALPPASPPARSVNEDRIEEIRSSLDSLYTLASNHAEYEDWKSAFVAMKAAAGMLENIVDEAGV